jgi:hypothetical protein
LSFGETGSVDGQDQYVEKSYIRGAAEVLDIEDTPDYSDILTDQLSSPEDVDAHQDESEMENPISDTIHVQPQQQANQKDHGQQQDTAESLMTPEATPESQKLSQPTDQVMDDTGWGRGYTLAPEGGELNRRSNNARRREEISSQVSEQFIWKGKRSRKPVNLGTYLATFAVCISKATQRSAKDQTLSRPAASCSQEMERFGSSSIWSRVQEGKPKRDRYFHPAKLLFGPAARASELIDAEILPLM